MDCIKEALDLKDTRIHSLEAGVEELKRALDHWTLMHIQESARSAKLEANLKIVVEALEKIVIGYMGDGSCECSYGEGRDCSNSQIAKQALYRLKPGGGE